MCAGSIRRDSRAPAALQWYLPGIHEASTHLRVPTNGRVDERLYSQLYEALQDIRGMTAPLRAKAQTLR